MNDKTNKIMMKDRIKQIGWRGEKKEEEEEMIVKERSLK